jgi:hypothetical protein
VIALSQCSGTTTGPEDAGSQPPPFVDPFTGATGCDGGLDAGLASCELMMPVDGALKGTLYVPFGPAAFCILDSNGGVGTSAMLDGNSIEVIVEPASPILPGQLAVGLPAKVILFESVAKQWVTPPTGCQITLTSNACAPNGPTPGRYLVSGTGSCSAPAYLARGDAGATVTIGDFYFTGELDFGD